jgi:hypothetical protein
MRKFQVPIQVKRDRVCGNLRVEILYKKILWGKLVRTVYNDEVK